LPFGFMIGTIACNAGHVVNDSLAGADDAIDQGGLDHVGTANNGHNWFFHGDTEYFWRISIATGTKSLSLPSGREGVNAKSLSFCDSLCFHCVTTSPVEVLPQYGRDGFLFGASWY